MGNRAAEYIPAYHCFDIKGLVEFGAHWVTEQRKNYPHVSGLKTMT